MAHVHPQVLCLLWEQEQVPFVCHSSNMDSTKKIPQKKQKNQNKKPQTKQTAQHGVLCKSTSFLGFSVTEM